MRSNFKFFEQRQIRRADLFEQFWISDDLPQINIDWRLQSRFQSEGSKFDTACIEKTVGQGREKVMVNSE